MSAISQYTVVRGDTLFAISRKFNMTVSDLKALNGLASDSLNIGQVLKVRVDSPFGNSTGTAPSTSNFSGGSSQSYVVVPGDTLFRIAGRFNMTVSELKALNGLVSDALSVGQVLKVRGSGSTTPVVNVPQQPVTTPVSTGNTGLYVVMPGDTLFALARRFGMTVSELKSINGLTSDALSVGQQLRIRGQGSGTVTPDPPFTPLPVQPPPVSTSGGDFLSARQQFRLDVRQESNARRYTLVVPLLNGGQVVASMRDNHTESRFMVFPNGILYHGQSNIELSVASIQAVRADDHAGAGPAVRIDPRRQFRCDQQLRLGHFFLRIYSVCRSERQGRQPQPLAGEHENQCRRGLPASVWVCGDRCGRFRHGRDGDRAR
ncbi:MAG: LysM peptidoglycan-binding domain-containing protein [Lewinellaceae bacterium]|nr:LysM peptidoglycan-binding domain-containing protein [Lewinellaceae bacterium]